jgi:type IV secretion system protein VirB9
MKKAHLLAALCILSGCTHDHDADTAPVRVDTPGMPSAELALQQSIDRVHGFIANMRQRLGDDPALRIRPGVALQSGGVMASHAPPPKPAATPTPPGSGSPRNATPIVGKGGVTWFAFGDGTPTINCHYPDICILRLDRGETALTSDLTVEDASNWHADLVRGGKGIHQGWAVAIDPGTRASRTALTLTGSQHTYKVLLDTRGDSMRTIAFTHAPGEPLSQPDITPQSSVLGTPDFAYRMTGDAPWKPMRVYREAGKTFIQFPPGGINAAPRLVVVAPAGKTTQDYTTIGDSYVIPRAIDDALLIGNEAGSPQIHITHGGTK